MKLSEILLKLRLSKKITTKDLSIAMEVEENDISFLENDSFTLISKSKTQDILKKYSKLFDINYNFLKKEYRKEIANNKFFLESNVRSGVMFCRFLKIFAFCFLILLFFCYVGFEIKNRYSKPILEIYNPLNDFVSKQREVSISGKSTKDVNIKINGELILISNEGSFKKNIVLNKGLNIVRITASKDNGEENVILKRIIFEDDQKVSLSYPQKY